MAKKKKTEDTLSIEEKERNSAYVAYKKAQRALAAVKETGNDVLIRKMQQTEKICFDRFLACEAALPEKKRFWKNGYRSIS